jgi:ABC-type polysaccharide/polyol phosphate transport system ATPase subunit
MTRFQKRKIDFSILLAFRQLASIKNSAKTNILVLDEILDAALDISAKRQAQQLISSIEDSNITVISHDDTSDDAYDRTLIFDKDSNEFSFYTER